MKRSATLGAATYRGMRGSSGPGHRFSGHGRRLASGRLCLAAVLPQRSPLLRGGVRYYNSPRAYRSACGYGDCACLRNIALPTGNPVWWDKYQACTG